jgi:hypothetical protein
MLKGILYTEDKNKHSYGKMGIIKPQQKQRQVIREQERISSPNTNPYKTKTTKW